MQVKKFNFMRVALGWLVAGGLLWGSPRLARADETPAAPVKIMLPAMRAGGIPPGQELQITGRGSELVAMTRLTLAAATPAVKAQRAPDAKAASNLFCAGSM
jgi:hypothetical protein